MIGMSSPGELVGAQQLPDLHLDELEQLRVVDLIDLLFMNTTSAGTPTWRASKMCSRVCGIGPSAAFTHQDARRPSAPPPVIMFFT